MSLSTSDLIILGIVLFPLDFLYLAVLLGGTVEKRWCLKCDYQTTHLPVNVLDYRCLSCGFRLEDLVE